MMLANPRDRGEQFVYFSGTMNGNPVASAAGLATLLELNKPGTYEALDAKGEELRSALADVAASHPAPVAVMAAGPLVGVAFTDGDVTNPSSDCR